MMVSPGRAHVLAVLSCVGPQPCTRWREQVLAASSAYFRYLPFDPGSWAGGRDPPSCRRSRLAPEAAVSLI